MDGGVDPSAGDTAWTEPDHHLPAVAAAGYYITRVLALMRRGRTGHWLGCQPLAGATPLITEGDIHWMTAGAVLSIC